MSTQPRRPHHPPEVDEYTLPTGMHPEYITSPKGVQGFGCKRFFVAQIPCGQAREIIVRNHYSGRVVNNSYLHMGIYLDGALKGVLQFGYTLNPRLAHKVVSGTEVGQYLELNRMWLCDSAPRNSESRAISYCIKYIKQAMPMVAWIQSFADERCGGLGVVYQASNFLYCGHHFTEFFRLDGEYYHRLLLTAHKKGGQRGRYLRANLDRAEKLRFRQFRYIYFIKKSWRGRLNFKVQPYPKPNR